MSRSLHGNETAIMDLLLDRENVRNSPGKLIDAWSHEKLFVSFVDLSCQRLVKVEMAHLMQSPSARVCVQSGRRSH